ncbi:MAG: hypothetical protein VB046_08320 [Paludibacter sp.]|nr:hypothetical protein [Paludibacter sp.]
MKTMLQFFKSHPEFITIPVIILLWIISIPILRLADPVSATFDAGVFQVPIFTVFQFLLYVATAWYILKLLFGTFYKYIKTKMKSDFNELTGWQKIKLSYSVFFILLALLAYLARTLVVSPVLS